MSSTAEDVSRPVPTDVLSTAQAGGKVIRGSAWWVGASATGIVAGVATAALLLRYLGVSESGRYVTVMSLVAIPVAVADLGLNVSASRELALRKSSARSALLGNILGQRLAIMPVALLAVVVFAVLAAYPSRMIAGTAIAGIGALLIAVAHALLLRQTVELRNAVPAFVEVARQMVTLAGIAALVVLGATLTPFFVVQIVAGAAVLALILPLAGARVFVLPRFDVAEQRLLFRTAFPMAAALALGQVYFRLVILLMSLISSPRQTGYFGGSLRAMEALINIPILVAGVALPLLTAAARDDRARFRYAVTGLSKGAVIAGVLVVIVSIRAAQPVMTIIGGVAFRPAGSVLRIQVGTLAFIALYQIWTASLLALGRQRELILTNAVALLGVGVFATALVPAFGAQGGAIASVLGDALLAALIYWRLHAAVGTMMVGAGFLLRVLAAAAVAAAPLFIPGLPDLAAAALAGALFLAVGQVIGVVPSEVLDAFALRRLLTRRPDRDE
jgi:O-antigen/teichoic acid export membrane protein